MASFQVAVCTLALLAFVQISSGFACNNGCNTCGGQLTYYPRYQSDSCYYCKPVFINCKGNGCGYGDDYKPCRNAVNKTFVGQSIPNKEVCVEEEVPTVVEEVKHTQVAEQHQKIAVEDKETKTVEGNEFKVAI